jgi:hypothetical protein
MRTGTLTRPNEIAPLQIARGTSPVFHRGEHRRQVFSGMCGRETSAAGEEWGAVAPCA